MPSRDNNAITDVEFDRISAILDKEAPNHSEGPLDDATVDRLRGAVKDYFDGKEVTRSVLGIDVYQYGRMPSVSQNLVPSLLETFRERAIHLSCTSEPDLLRSEDFRLFVPTGDGGFQIFTTPLQAVVFAVFFEWHVTSFNSYKFLPRLRAVLPHALTLRYALTFDKLFKQFKNEFGVAIINNARIMARDKLNRFLLDERAVEWFRERITSLESLSTLRAQDLARLATWPKHPRSVTKSALFGPRHEGRGVRSAHLQKIGVVSSKESKLDIYSLMLQAGVPTQSILGQPKGTAVVTVGNLNPSGLEERAG